MGDERAEESKALCDIELPDDTVVDDIDNLLMFRDLRLQLNKKCERPEGAEEGTGPKIDDYKNINNDMHWRAM